LHTSSSAAMKAAATTLKAFSINYKVVPTSCTSMRLTWSCARWRICEMARASDASTGCSREMERPTPGCRPCCSRPHCSRV